VSKLLQVSGVIIIIIIIHLIRRSSKELSLNNTYNTMLKNCYK